MDFKVGFSRSISPWKIGSLAIQISEKRDFSHAYIRYTCPLTGVEMVSQASHGFVNEVSFDVFKHHNIVVEEYVVSCTDEQFLEVLKKIKTNLGVKYSTLQIICIAIKKVLRYEIKVYNHDKQYICSEWAAVLCKIVGIKSPDNLDYYTPSDFNKLIKSIKLIRVL